MKFHNSENICCREASRNLAKKAHTYSEACREACMEAYLLVGKLVGKLVGSIVGELFLGGGSH